MDTAYVIGNGESRNIYPIETLKGNSIIYGCNAIYRDRPDLCDHIVAVNPPMYEELKKWHETTDTKVKIHGPEDISNWNYVCQGDNEDDVPEGLKLYRIWRGGDIKKNNAVRTLDFTKHRGSGMSAVLMAAESGIKNVVMLAFDIMGARQWEFQERGEHSREQNNIYKNTLNYPTRMSMKAYLKYEWLFQLRQITKHFPETNFYYINRKEYLESNPFLPNYLDQPNVKCGIYADLKRWAEGSRDKIEWCTL